MSQTYEYSYTTSSGSSGAVGGYTVEYSSSSASGGDAIYLGSAGGSSGNTVVLTSGGGLSGSASNTVLLGGGASGTGLSSGTVYVTGGGSSSGGSTVYVSGGAAGAGASGSSSGAVGQIASDLLALGGAGGAAGAGGSTTTTTTIISGGGASGAGFGGFTGGASGAGGAGGSVTTVISGGGALEASAFSAVEQAILRANNPLEFNETEVITVNGQTGVWTNRNEVVNWRGVIPITQYVINEDAQPEVIRKRTEQVLTYEQEIAIRYLRPPTPPPPGEILIRQEKNIITPPAPPLVIRQQPPRPETPAPLVIREAPPRPPAAVGQKVITISGKRLPPPPRKVIIERLAPLPSKPQSVIIERWLPYNQNKRRVIFQKSQEADPVIPRPRNVIIQWEAPQVQIRKEFKDLGVIRANPVEYVQRYGASLKTHVELPQFVREIRPPTGVVLAAEHTVSNVFELEGDIQALNLIDLDREGLGEYRAWLSRFLASGGGSFAVGGGSAGGSSSTTIVYGGAGGAAGSGSASGSTTVVYTGGASGSGGSVVVGGGSAQALLGELFQAVDRNASGRISRSEAEKLLLTFNSRLGRAYGENEVNIFFRALDVNGDGLIDFEEFRNAITRQFLVL